jgi:hypothetical protein
VAQRNAKPFRCNSSLFIRYPWRNGIVLEEETLHYWVTKHEPSQINVLLSHMIKVRTLTGYFLNIHIGFSLTFPLSVLSTVPCFRYRYFRATRLLSSPIPKPRMGHTNRKALSDDFYRTIGLLRSSHAWLSIARHSSLVLILALYRHSKHREKAYSSLNAQEVTRSSQGVGQLDRRHLES